MGRTNIPGLTKEAKLAFFSSTRFDELRAQLGRVVTVGEQHQAIEGLFLEAKKVKIDGKQFDTMAGRSNAYNCNTVPAIRSAGIQHAFSWIRGQSRIEGDTLLISKSKPKLSALVLPRSFPKNVEVSSRIKPFTTFLYDFDTHGNLTQARTTDQFSPLRLCFSPDEPVTDTIFGFLSEYVRQRVEAHLVVVAGQAFIDRPESLPPPVPYTAEETEGL